MKKSFKNILGIVLAFALICGAVFSNKIDVYASSSNSSSSEYSTLIDVENEYNTSTSIIYVHDKIIDLCPYYFIVYNTYHDRFTIYFFEKQFGVYQLGDLLYLYTFDDDFNFAEYHYIYSEGFESNLYYLDYKSNYHYTYLQSSNFRPQIGYTNESVYIDYRNVFISANYNVPNIIRDYNDGVESFSYGSGYFYKMSNEWGDNGEGGGEWGDNSSIPIENPDDTIEGNIFTWIKSILINIVNLPIKISVALQGFFDDLPSNIAMAFSSILTKITTKVEALKLGIDDLPSLIATSLSSFFTNIVIKVQEVKDKVGDIFDSIKSLPETLFTKFTRLFIPDEDFMHSKILQLTDHLTKFGIKTYDITSLFAKEQAITSFEGTYRGKEVTFIDMRYLDLFLNKFRPVIRGFIVLCLMLFNVNQFLNLIGQGSISVSGVLNAVKERDKGDKE